MDWAMAAKTISTEIIRLSTTLPVSLENRSIEVIIWNAHDYQNEKNKIAFTVTNL